MTRTLADMEYPTLAIPGGVAIVASYGDGTEAGGFAKLSAMYPATQKLEISHSGESLTAQCFDVERGAITEDHIVALVVGARQRGITPWVYLSDDRWTSVMTRFDRARTAQPLWWVANWNNTPRIQYGAIGHQYGGAPGYDMSIMVDYIPGFDLAIPKPKGPTMATMYRQSEAGQPDYGNVFIDLGGGKVTHLQPGEYADMLAIGIEQKQLTAEQWHTIRTVLYGQESTGV